MAASTTIPAQRKRANEVSRMVVTAGMKVHTALGPGLLENTYRYCLAQELRNQGLSLHIEVPLPVFYEGTKLEIGYRLDLLVEDLIVVEVKAIEALAPIHSAQILSYLKLSGKELGLLMNFNTVHLKDGIKRFVLGSGWE